ncbi:MAG: HD domain-containing protein [Bacillus subtilis]|nr:HD domain-containing protein [Bacillus subtilis]
MLTIEQLRKQVRLRLESRGGSFRYTHILGVEEVAVQIALSHGLSERAARQAALIHDATKYDAEAEHIERITRTFGPAELARIGPNRYGIAYRRSITRNSIAELTSPDVLLAIQYHGSGQTGDDFARTSRLRRGLRRTDRDRLKTITSANSAMRDLRAALLQSINEIVAHESARGHRQPLAITKAAIAYYQESKEETHESIWFTPSPKCWPA